MRIYVRVKHVPDTAAKIKITNDTAYDSQVKFLANPYDEYGVTELVILTAGDIVISERPETAAEALAQGAAAFGVTALLGVSSPAGNDLLARAAVALKAPPGLGLHRCRFSEK